MVCVCVRAAGCATCVSLLLCPGPLASALVALVVCGEYRWCNSEINWRLTPFRLLTPMANGLLLGLVVYTYCSNAV